MILNEIKKKKNTTIKVTSPAVNQDRKYAATDKEKNISRKRNLMSMDERIKIRCIKNIYL